MTRACRTCVHWSAYMADLGECLEYITRRQDAWARADDVVTFHRAWPHKAAENRRGHERCERHEPETVGTA